MAHLSDLPLEKAGTHRGNKVGVHKLLTAEQITNRLDGFDLMLLVGGVFQL